MFFPTRSDQKEFLDLGFSHFSLAEYHNCLKQLGKIGRYLRGNHASFKSFNALNFIPKSILDVGSGGGHFAALLAKRFPNTKIVGIDTCKEAIEYAKDLYGKSNANLHFVYKKNPHLLEPKNSFDIVTTTLVCHHMTDDEIIQFIKDACRVSNKVVIINDLHRHFLAYAFFCLIAPICFRSRLVFHDGLLSIKRAFTRKDWVHYLKSANICPSCWKISWNFAFRWIITIKADKK